MTAATAPMMKDARAPADSMAELRALLLLATPLVGANLLQMAVAAVDVVFVSRLGTTEFAAATLGVFMFNLCLYGLFGLTGAAAPIIAAELGRRRHAVREVRRSFRMALWLAVIASVLLMAVLAQGERLLLIAGQDAVVAGRAGAFLDIVLWGLIPGAAAAVMRTAAAALGRQGWAFAVTVVALVVAIIGNWCLVFGNAGFPALGLEGSAIATLVTLTATMLAYAAILVVDPKLRRYRLFGRWWRTEWSRFFEIVRLGVPIALTWTFEGALFGGAAILMGLIGVAEIAAHAVALNIAAVTFQVPLGLAQAATIRVGTAYGARDAVWIGRAGQMALTVGIGFMSLTAILFWAMPRTLISVYVDADAPENARVVALAIQYMGVAALFQIVDGAQVVAAGVLRGVQDTRVPMLIALFGYWVVGFGTAMLLGFTIGWAGVGIWLGLAAGLLAVSAMLLWRWRARGRLGLLPE